MKSKIILGLRLIFGLMFLLAGVVGLLNLVPPPPDLPENMIAFNNGLNASGYFMKLLKLTEITCGLMLLSGYFVPLALVILAPIVLNIFLVHLFMQPAGLPIAIIMGLILVYLSFFAEPYSKTIRSLFRR